jgi:hypothetical protein
MATIRQNFKRGEILICTADGRNEDVEFLRYSTIGREALKKPIANDVTICWINSRSFGGRCWVFEYSLRRRQTDIPESVLELFRVEVQAKEGA